MRYHVKTRFYFFSKCNFVQGQEEILLKQVIEETMFYRKGSLAKGLSID
jgi:hypothetical protein